MSQYAIQVRDLSKSYTIGAYQGRYKSLRDSLTQAVTGAVDRLGRLGRLGRGAQDNSERTIWALKDVSFDIAHGEVVGIIGRNGAGKSTLLKLLARITEPTAGEIRMHGRVGSLLEVGTGFHPELTGRENIFLNGAILGMSRREIQRKFDEIVDFAEIEKFIDTPAKHYSSGMYMRLAFAVAAHLEPEILLVDEVLAVGDAQFQKKCLGKMGEVAKEGRTVLFVSHNMGAVIQLCSRGILLSKGSIITDSNVEKATSEYLNSYSKSESSIDCIIDPNKDVQITHMSLTSFEGDVISSQPHNHPFKVKLKYVVKNWNIGSYVCIDVFNENDVRLLWSSDVTTTDEMVIKRDPGTYEAEITIPGMLLSPGNYSFTLAIYSPGWPYPFDVKEKAVSIQIIDGGSFLSNFGIRPHSATMIPLSWKINKLV